MKLLEVFLDQKKASGPRKHLGGLLEGSSTHQAAKRPRRTLVGPAHIGGSLNRLFAL